MDMPREDKCSQVWKYLIAGNILIVYIIHLVAIFLMAYGRELFLNNFLRHSL